jgi:hypothetical protein
MIDYGNEKLNQIFQDTWPNLGWAKKDMDIKFAGNYPGPLYAPHPDIKKMTHEEMLEEAERREKSNRVLQRYNDYYNMECAGLPHGTPITPEHQQIITLQSMIDAIRCEYLNREYNDIAISDIEDLIQRLDEQATAFLKRVKEFKDSADGVA